MADACGRLIRELKEARNSTSTDVVLNVTEGNLFEWEAYIEAPKDTPYEGGRFKLLIKCPPSYPISPPTITFLTPIFHPNIHWRTGEICLDVLKTQWSPAWTLQFVCRAIASLLADSNAESPLNCDAGNLVRSGDIRGYNSLARMYTEEFAMGLFTAAGNLPHGGT